MKNLNLNNMIGVLMDNIPVAVFYIDTCYNIEWSNMEYRSITGLPLDFIIGNKCYSIWGHSEPCTGCPVPSAREKGEPVDVELFRDPEVVSKGKGYWIMKALPVKHETGEIKGFIVTKVPNTENMEIRNALEKSESRLKEAQRLAHIGSWELDLVSDKLFWSDEIFEIFEIDKSSFEGSYKAFLDAIHPDDRDLVNREFRRSVKNKTPYSIDHRLLMKNGKIKFVHERCETFYNVDRKPVRSIGTVQDITDRILALQENQKLQTQIQHVQRMESIGRLAGGVAHDFKNMVTVILGYIDLLLKQSTDPETTQNHLKKVRKVAKRQVHLINQLLAFAREQTVTPEILDLNNVIEDMLPMLQSMAGENIKLHFEPGENPKSVLMDPVQIDQILTNLCVNARDAIYGKGEIVIETKNISFSNEYCSRNPDFIPGEFVMISVRDNGSGISDELIPHIFEPFFTTKKADVGTGLGLSTVYGIVQQNKGFINVQSESGNGTTFNIFLTVHKEKSENEKV